MTDKFRPDAALLPLMPADMRAAFGNQGPYATRAALQTDPRLDDPDNPEWTEEDFARSTPVSGVRLADLKVGDRVPMPERKLDIRPAFTGSGQPSFKPARHGSRGPGK